MRAWLRIAALPTVASVLVAGVLGVQLAHGGGRFEPMQVNDSCTPPAATSVSSGISGLAEQLVLRGVNNAACSLGVSREQLTLDLARGSRTTEQVEALTSGLLRAVEQLEQEGALPPISSLTAEALPAVDLPGWVKWSIERLPDSLIDSALPTDAVLTRAVGELDLKALLGNLDRPEDITRLVEPAIVQAVKDTLVQRLRDLV